MNFWDHLAKRYDRLNSKYEAQYRDTVDITKRYLEPGHRVLDFGCGTGITTMELAGSVKQIVAVDNSECMLDIAKIKSAEMQVKNIEFRAINIQDSFYEKMSFDVVLVFNTLQYIRNVEEVLARIYGLLPVGGLFISVSDCMGEKPSPLFTLSRCLSGAKLLPYMKYYTMITLEEEIKQHGFEIIETRNLHPQPPNYLIVSKKSTR